MQNLPLHSPIGRPGLFYMARYWYVLYIADLYIAYCFCDASKLISTISISMTQSYTIFTVSFASEIVVRIVAKTRSFETPYMDVHPMHSVILS